MTIKRSTLIEGILIICMVAILGLVTAIREPAAEKNQVKTIEEPKVEIANIYILKNIHYTGTYVVGTWTDEFGNEQQVRRKQRDKCEKIYDSFFHTSFQNMDDHRTESKILPEKIEKNRGVILSETDC